VTDYTYQARLSPGRREQDGGNDPQHLPGPAVSGTGMTDYTYQAQLSLGPAWISTHTTRVHLPGPAVSGT
jgi:hypothetical protein